MAGRIQSQPSTGGRLSRVVTEAADQRSSVTVLMMEVVLYKSIGVLAGILGACFNGPGRGGLVLSYITGAVYFVLAGVATSDVTDADPPCPGAPVV